MGEGRLEEDFSSRTTYIVLVCPSHHDALHSVQIKAFVLGAGGVEDLRNERGEERREEERVRREENVGISFSSEFVHYTHP